MLMLKIETSTPGTNSMPFLIFRRDHLRSSSGIICGSGSFGAPFGDHLRAGGHLQRCTDIAFFLKISFLIQQHIKNRHLLLLLSTHNYDKTSLRWVIVNHNPSKTSWRTPKFAGKANLFAQSLQPRARAWCVLFYLQRSFFCLQRGQAFFQRLLLFSIFSFLYVWMEEFSFTACWIAGYFSFE